MKIDCLLALLAGFATSAMFGHQGLAQTTASSPASDAAAQRTETENEPQKFVRLSRSSEGKPQSLEVAVVRFVSPADAAEAVVVDLVSAIHVADGEYYAQLNDTFRKYDAVLYELVAPEGTRVPKGGGGGTGSPVSWIQQAMTKVLGLSFQLEEIDYTVENLIHADMSPEEFAQSMKDRGESVFAVMLKLMMESLRQQSQDPARINELKLLAALVSANREHELKLVMAEQFADMDRMLQMLGGDKGSTLLTERNKKALAVLSRELEAGKRNFAIFYGAGHMPDIQSRLENEFGMQREGEWWLTAWDLTTPGDKAKP